MIPIEGPLHKLQPLEFEQVRRMAQEPLFNSLMEENHYLVSHRCFRPAAHETECGIL